MFSRWISADDISYLDSSTIGGLNFFAYCGNNPVMCFMWTQGFAGNARNYGIQNSNSGIVQSNGFIGIGGSIIGGSGSINSGSRNRAILPIIDKIFDSFDNIASGFAGGIDGFLGMIDFNPFLKYSIGLNKFSNIMMGIAITLDIGMSAYTNFTNDNLSTGQKWGSFGADVGYIGAKAVGTYYAGFGVGKLAVTAGMAAGGFAITTLGFGFMGAIVIGKGAAVIVGVAGAIAIIYITDKLDDLWGNLKNKWFK